ncbi:hypothetical protein GCM10027589_07480 [Actinocorallia lasiicapitis]
MSVIPRSTGRKATLGVTALGLIAYALYGLDAGSPASAAPISVDLTYSCVFPVIGKKEIKINIKTDIPAKLPVDVAMPRIKVDAVAALTEDTTNGLLSLGAETMRGGAITYATLSVPEFPNGIRLKVGAKMAPTTIPPAGATDVIAKGSAIGPTLVQAGPGKITIGDILLKPDLRDKDGQPTDLGEDFSVTCKQNPGQNPVLAQFEVLGGADTKAPTKPGKPEITKLRSSAVTLTWGASTDDVEVAGYDVYYGDKVVPNEKITGNTGVVSGLKPETEYTLNVRARDLSGNVSEASEPITFRTPKYVPDTEAPSAPTELKLLNNSSATAIRVGWGASTDNEEVTSYVILADGAQAGVAEGTATDSWVYKLAPRKKYVVTVRAKDEAGNLSKPSAPLTVQMPAGPPANCGDIKRDGYKNRGCIFMSGFSNINKLKAATEINGPKQNPALTNATYRVQYDKNKQLTTTTVKFAMDKPIRSRSTFLTLGIMPTTGTVELEQVGDGTLVALSPDGQDTSVTGKISMRIRLYDVTVNGAPLKLGANCRSAQPVEIALKGGAPDYTDPLLGGVLRGQIPIPSFAGCGVEKEQLSRLLSTLISGPNNLLKITQGPVCRADTGNCAPIEPKR